jgi:hypothetical protein
MGGHVTDVPARNYPHAKVMPTKKRAYSQQLTKFAAQFLLDCYR